MRRRLLAPPCLVRQCSLLLCSSLALLGACQSREPSPQSAEDRRITQEVRRAVAGAQAISAHFEQVQVVTHDGVVQLLGPTGSGEEKALIGALAQKVEGVRRIDNQLEVRLSR